MMPRAHRDFSRAPAVPRMASTGGVRAASRAGRRAPTTVTSRPMTMDVVMTLLVMGTPPPGRGMP